jgi:hypothetical protein
VVRARLAKPMASKGDKGSIPLLSADVNNERKGEQPMQQRLIDMMINTVINRVPIPHYWKVKEDWTKVTDIPH